MTNGLRISSKGALTGNKDVIEDHGGANQEGRCYNKSKGKIEDDFFDGMQRATTIDDGPFTAATAKQRCARVERYRFNDAEWNCGEHEAKQRGTTIRGHFSSD